MLIGTMLRRLVRPIHAVRSVRAITLRARSPSTVSLVVGAALVLMAAPLAAQLPEPVPAPVPDTLRMPAPDPVAVPVDSALILYESAAAVQAAEAADVAPPAPDRWAAQLEFGFNGARGNTELVTLSTGFSIKRTETDRFELELETGYRYGESEGSVVARNIQSSLSFDLFPAGPWSPFIYVAAERDPFKRLDIRTDGGAGAKYTLNDGDRGTASLSLALLHTYENFRPTEAIPETPVRSDARWSMRARAKRRMAEGWQVENTTFYKPVYDQLGDYDVDSVTKLNAILNSRLAVTFSYTYRLDSTPPEGVGREDQILTAGLTINL